MKPGDTSFTVIPATNFSVLDIGPGKISSTAASFNGSTTHITIMNNTHINPSSLTVSGWMKRNDSSSWMMIDKASGGTSGSYYIYGDTGGDGK